MSNATERLLRRNVKLVPRRPGRPRELAFDATKNLLTWAPPASKRVPFTHYRVRVDTDSGAPAFQVSAAQRSVVLTSGSRVFVSAFNETTGLESANAELAVTITAGLGEAPLAPPPAGITVKVDYSVVEGRASGKRLLVQISGDVTPPDSPYYAAARIEIALPDTVIDLGRTLGDHSFVTEWKEIPPGAYQVRAYSINRTGLENPEPYVSSEPLVIETLGPCPDVLLFRAGRSLGDGTFEPVMHWDGIRQCMLIDWACVLPPHLVNWSGVAIWARTPAGNYSRLTDVIEKKRFSVEESGVLYLYDTIILELQEIPSSPESWTLIAVSYDLSGDPNLDEQGNVHGPQVQVQTLAADSGREYADLVTNLNAAVPTPAYVVNGQGQKVLRVNISWQNPSDVRFGGAVLWVIWYDGNHYQITGIGHSGNVAWETPNFPSTHQSVTFYVLSADKANRTNTYVPGITPSKTISIPPPDSGPLGQEYTSSVPYGGYTAMVSYPSTADGTYNAHITAYFAPPSDPTWGGVELVLRHGTNEMAKLRTNASPALLTVPVPDTSQSWSLYFVSYDVNGRRNSITTGTPMVSLFVGSAAGKLRLNRADPNSIELNHFTIVNNKLRIFQIDGDLIVSGTISSAHLHTNGIDVGGGSGMPGQIRVWNAYGQQIGYIGVDGGDDTWLKALKVGGPNKNNPHIISRADGTTDIIDASLTISKLGIEISINAEQDSEYVRGICVKNTQPGYGNRRILIGDNQVWAVGYSGNLNFTLINYSRQDFFDFGALTIRGAGGRWVMLNENNSGNVQCSHDVLANGTVRGTNFSVFSFGQERPGLNYEVYDRDGKKLTFLAGLLVSVV